VTATGQGQMTPIDSRLIDPDSSWWAKYGHAQSHIERLTTVHDSYYESEPFRIEEEPTAQPDKLAARLRLLQPIPAEIPLIVGDVLHNLRSALDSLVYELTTQAAGRPLNTKEARACQFPILPDPTSFDEFFTKKSKTRDQITPQDLRDVIRSAQPFFHIELGRRSGIQSADDLDYETHYQHSDLGVLGYMSNIDKHRRLALTAWRPNTVWWGSDGDSNRRWLPGDGTFEDGSIIGYIVGTGENDGDVVYDFNLTLPDLPAYADPLATRDDVVRLAEGWAQTTAITINQLILSWHASRGT
jgi:hypothetical protein